MNAIDVSDFRKPKEPEDFLKYLDLNEKRQLMDIDREYGLKIPGNELNIATDLLGSKGLVKFYSNHQRDMTILLMGVIEVERREMPVKYFMNSIQPGKWLIIAIVLISVCIGLAILIFTLTK